MDQVFIQQPFAFAGDVAPIPFPVDLGGNVSFNQGYGVDYQRDLSSDPLAKAIERDKQNYLFNVITQQLQQYQIFGTPEFITSADNGGVPYSYATNARVRYRTTPGDPWNVYISLVDSNTELPTVTTHWRTVDQALTAPQFDNDTSIATTAFVRAAGMQSNGIAPIVAATVLTTADIGTAKVLQGAGGFTVTLPPAASCPAGTRIEFFCGASSATVARQGADVIYSTYEIAGGITSLAMGKGDTLTLIAIPASNGWYAVGQPQLFASSKFAAVRAANGYTTQPDGTLRQYGITTSSAVGDVSVNFPIAFPSACRSIQLTYINGVTSTAAFASVGSQGLSSFTLGGWNSVAGSRGVVSVFWEATGY